MSHTTLVSSPRPSDQSIVGYVEGRSAEEIVGWTWRPGSDERLRVELRSGDDVIASAMANGSREDLSRNGIGDGCHAFRLIVSAETLANHGTTKLFAVDEANIAVELEEHRADTRHSHELHRIQRGLDLLLGSHRVLHRNIQSALLKQNPSLDGVLGEVCAAQQRLNSAITTLEIFAVRIEMMLSKHELPLVSEQGQKIGTAKLLTLLSVLAFAISCVALWRSLIVG